ncbi:helix-turn-helix domain-containing protein [Paenibacillus bouchesdurhonensis]|uniref:helix-turn-helix domain-containing protein n=1 Tax=Paenibacillus bouchesdurhonensis TaxID=1870990 RepID=UPI000DA624B4|nr:helix-turn-helix transcriptional regulator [Paenibacillus bouchesdurhonensis]
MKSVFNSAAVRSDGDWVYMKDIDQKKIQQWNGSFTLSGHHSFMDQLKFIPADEMNCRLDSHQDLISVVEEELKALHRFLVRPFIFILTDVEGVTLSLNGPETVIAMLKEHNVKVGSLFDMKHAGINAVSVAMETDTIAVVRGEEHHLRLFAGWSCICAPIHINGEIKGYLDMSLSVNEDITYIIPLLQQLIDRVKGRWPDPELRKQAIFQAFDKCGLTKREKEIGYLWMHNHSAFEIAEMLYIAPGTVKNTLKNVYKKSNVSDKGDFIIKFYLWNDMDGST